MGAYDFLVNGAQGVQLPDQMAMAQRAMSLAQIANQNQLAQYTLAQAQRKDTAATAAGQALGGLDINDDNAVRQAINAAPPDARAPLYDQILKMRKESAEAGFKKSEASAKDFEVQKGKIGLVGNMAAFLANKPDLNQQDIMTAAGVLKTNGLDPSVIIPPQGADPRQHLSAVAGQAMDAVKQLEIQGANAGRAETARHNKAEEGLTQTRDTNTANYQRGELNVRNAELQNSNMRARAAMVTADPFGLSGLNTGTPAGGAATVAPASPAGMQIPPAVQAQRDAQAYDMLVAERAKAPDMQTAAQLDRELQARFPKGRPTVDAQAPAQAPAGGVAGAMQAGATGDEFLKSLPPQVAGMVKAMVEGRQSPPAGAALRSPQIQQLIMLANQYDPTFDATTWGARASMAKDWGDQGKIGQSNLAINTVIGHLGDLKKSADALNNFSYTPVNKVVNTVQDWMGDPRYQAFNANAGAVVKELERAYRGTGGSQADIDAMKGELNSSNSPQQLTAVIQKYVDLLQSKIEANADAYKKTMGREPPPLLSNKAQATRDALAGNKPASRDEAIKQAMDAIARGAPRDKVMQRLQEMGITDAKI